MIPIEFLVLMMIYTSYFMIMAIIAIMLGASQSNLKRNRIHSEEQEHYHEHQHDEERQKKKDDNELHSVKIISDERNQTSHMMKNGKEVWRLNWLPPKHLRLEKYYYEDDT